MKNKLTISITAGIASFAVIYLIGAFVNADFNICNWSIGMRAFIAFCGLTAVILVIGCIFDN